MNELIVNNLSEISKSEIDVAVATAKKYPRDIKMALKKAEQLATFNEDIAQSCFYVLARKDKDGNKKEIIGPSIRLAEILSSQWTNLRIGSRIISNDGRFITVEGVVIDCETNTTYLVPIQLAIFGKNKDGKVYTYNENMQQTLTMSAIAKATRNAIFKAINLSFVIPIMQSAIKASVGDQKTINAKVTDIVDKLVKMGIDKQKMLDYYECKTMADITPAIYKSLIGLGTGIKEGHIKIDEVFMPEGVKAVENNNATERLAALANAKDTVNKETGEVTKQKPEPTEDQLNFESVKGMLANAKNEDELFIAADLIVNVKDKVLNAELLEIYKNKLAGFKK